MGCEDCQWDIANKRGKILVTWGKYFNETQNACAHCPPGKQIYAAAMEKQKSGNITSFNSSNKPCEPCPAGKVKGSAEELCEDCTAVRVAHAPAAFTCKVRCKKQGCSFLKASMLFAKFRARSQATRKISARSALGRRSRHQARRTRASSASASARTPTTRAAKSATRASTSTTLRVNVASVPPAWR